MQSNALRTALAVTLAFCAVGPAHAFRCGTRIITPADHAHKANTLLISAANGWFKPSHAIASAGQL